MFTFSSWTLWLFALVATVLTLHAAGVDVTPAIGAAVKGFERLLAAPL